MRTTENQTQSPPDGIWRRTSNDAVSVTIPGGGTGSATLVLTRADLLALLAALDG